MRKGKKRKEKKRKGKERKEKRKEKKKEKKERYYIKRNGKDIKPTIPILPFA